MISRLRQPSYKADFSVRTTELQRRMLYGSLEQLCKLFVAFFVEFIGWDES